MSSGVSGFGTKLIWNFHDIIELTNISGPSEAMDPIEVTSHESADEFREFVAGLRNGGDISIEGNLITTDEDGIIGFYTDVQGGTERAMMIVLPMALGVSWDIQALAKGFTPSMPHDGKMAISGVLQVTGKPSLRTTQSAGISALAGIEENAGAALSISPAIAAGTYAYTCTVNTASSWVKLTVTAGSHTVYIDGDLEATGVQTGEITLGAADSTTEILIIVYESAKAPRIYTLTVTRPAA